jgi:hypothetical protein
MGLLRYFRGEDLLKDRSTPPAAATRTLAMGEQSRAFLYPTHRTSLVVGESNVLRVADAWACLGSGWLVEGSVPAGFRPPAFARARAGLDPGSGGRSWQ